MSESMFSKYFKERVGGEVIEDDSGFVAYRVMPSQKEVFIHEIFVTQEARSFGIGGSLLDRVSELVKPEGVQYMTASISHAALNATAALRAALAYGFKVHSSNVNEIFIMKEI